MEGKQVNHGDHVNQKQYWNARGAVRTWEIRERETSRRRQGKDSGGDECVCAAVIE